MIILLPVVKRFEPRKPPLSSSIPSPALTMRLFKTYSLAFQPSVQKCGSDQTHSAVAHSSSINLACLFNSARIRVISFSRCCSIFSCSVATSVRVFNCTANKLGHTLYSTHNSIWDHLLIWCANIVLQLPYNIICFNKFFCHSLNSTFSARNNPVLFFNDSCQTNLWI